MKIAILHEMLIKLGGAEKVVENWVQLFPDAPIFTLIYDEKKVGNIFPKEKLSNQTFKTKSQKIYKIFKKQRFCLPFMAESIESFDFSEFDVILCSSSGFAHGAITKPETKFIVYYHSPARYIWDWTNEYKRDLCSGWKKIFLKPIINSLFFKLRKWDYIASNRADISLANSLNTQKRIWKYYRKKAEILYPPVEIDRFKIMINDKGLMVNSKENYYIIISALTEFKKIEIAIEGFNKLNETKDKKPKTKDKKNFNNYNLTIIGVGDYKRVLEKIVTGKNIKFIGAKYGDELVELIQNSFGLIFPGEEDFGIVPIEVLSAGKPVFAYKGGGLLETNITGVTGEFFEDKQGNDFVEKFKKFDNNNRKGKYKAEDCAEQAKKFDKKIFEKRILELVKGEE